MDPTGRFIVGHAYAKTKGGFSSQLVLWQDGRPRTVVNPGSDFVISAVNSKEVAIVTNRADGPVSSVYHDGKLSRLSTRPLVAHGINDARRHRRPDW